MKKIIKNEPIKEDAKIPLSQAILEALTGEFEDITIENVLHTYIL